MVAYCLCDMPLCLYRRIFLDKTSIPNNVYILYGGGMIVRPHCLAAALEW